MPPAGDLLDPGIEPTAALQADSLPLSQQGSPMIQAVGDLVPTLCDPIDGSPPGCSVHGIAQARILEWVAISFSRWSSRPKANNTSAIIPDSVPVLHSCHHLWEVLLNPDSILKTNEPKGSLQKQSTYSVVDPPFVFHREALIRVLLF